MFEFIESAAFEKFLAYYLDDDEYGELQQFMMRHPEAGTVVPGSGGVRKLRWRRGGTGKRGGLRVIDYVRLSAEPILEAYTLFEAEAREYPSSRPPTTKGGIRA